MANIFDDNVIPPSPQRMPILSGTEGAASIPTVAVASLMNDPQARIRYYSREMNIPIERFGVADGDIVYQTDSGSLQRVSPGFIRGLAKDVGPSIPAIGSAFGTIPGLLMASNPVTAPASIPVATTGGTAGAMTGQYARELLANQIAGQDISAARVATEGVVDMAASLTGLLVGKGLTKAAATRAGKQFSQAMKSGAGDAARALKDTLAKINEQYGTNIKLTPAELTGSAELVGAQKALTADPRTSEFMSKFAQDRAEQISIAAGKSFEDIAPKATSPESTGRQLAEASAEAIKNIERQRKLAGSPAYRKAFEAGTTVNIRPFDTALLQAADDFQPLKGALNKIRSNYTKTIKAGGGTQRVLKSDVSLEYVQNNIKEIIDDEIKIATRQGATKKAGRLLELQEKLLKDMDSQVPEFASARAAWGDLSKPVNEVEGGILPALANKNIRDFEYMGARFLTSSSPSAIRQAKANILSIEGGEDVWNATVRGALEAQWEKSNKVFASQISRPDLVPTQAPARFWSAMVGNPEQLKRLEAAMSPDQMKAFKNLASIMQAASRAAYTGTDTQMKQAAERSFEASSAAGTAIKYALSPWRIPGAASDAVGQAMSDANVKRLSETITNSNAVEALVALRSGQGGWASPRNLMIAGRALAQAGMMTGELVKDFEDRPPQSIMSGGAPSMTQGMNIFD